MTWMDPVFVCRIDFPVMRKQVLKLFLELAIFLIEKKKTWGFIFQSA